MLVGGRVNQPPLLSQLRLILRRNGAPCLIQDECCGALRGEVRDGTHVRVAHHRLALRHQRLILIIVEGDTAVPRVQLEPPFGANNGPTS
eukprot:1647122-Prymnesium_polylepis.3